MLKSQDAVLIKINGIIIISIVWDFGTKKIFENASEDDKNRSYQHCLRWGLRKQCYRDLGELQLQIYMPVVGLLNTPQS